ncbi:MAG: TIGR04283 family arsenosugar biosynthesis glycosyltransferase [Chlorobiaceae bacterium]
MAPPLLSIIIPAWNEEAVIEHFMRSLLAITDRSCGVEIIVSDAGSDRTADILSAFPVTVVRSAKGRAVQMNTGARKATGDILYFLHADTIPPETFIEDIRSAAESGKKAGCFRMAFDDDHPLMSLFGWFTQFPLPVCRGGDQSLFIERALFDEIGGYDERQLIMEDYDIVRRIEERHTVHILLPEVKTSSRKYQKNGIIRLQMIFGTLHLMHALGYNQEDIIRCYNENIS